jgi:hypothetical protein
MQILIPCQPDQSAAESCKISLFSLTSMEFSPANPIVKLCLQGMDLEAREKPGEAREIFLNAWHEAANDFEKFISAYYVARHQPDVPETLKWLQTCLDHALKVDSAAVRSAFPSLYERIAECYKSSGDEENASRYYELAKQSNEHPDDRGPFYHGTRADIKPGEYLNPGFNSNYRSDLKMNHIYFTALVNGAGLAAELAKGDGPGRVYIVEPAGSFENDPNVTNKKFPGNPTRSYRTSAPLKVVGEVTDWHRLSPQELQKWREKLANNKGEIIN